MPLVKALDTMAHESHAPSKASGGQLSTKVSEVHSLSRLPAMLISLSRQATVVEGDPDIQQAEMNIRKRTLGSLAMSNMKRRQKLHLEETVGRMNNLDREIEGLKVRTEMHKLKESV